MNKAPIVDQDFETTEKALAGLSRVKIDEAIAETQRDADHIYYIQILKGLQAWVANRGASANYALESSAYSEVLEHINDLLAEAEK